MTSQSSYYIEPAELSGFKQKTEELILLLQENDQAKVIKCIDEINRIHDQSIFPIVGKLTRGLHNAISDLNVPTLNGEPEKNKTRAGLNYVIEVTSDAAQKTLDMTEQSQTTLNRISDNIERQTALIERIAGDTATRDLSAVVQEIRGMASENQENLSEISRNIMEIVIAQNYQDLASQSIKKAIKIINDVESSLISLTQYTKILGQLHRYNAEMDESRKEEENQALRNDLEQLDRVGDAEHLDQNDVDNLLSSLGF